MRWDWLEEGKAEALAELDWMKQLIGMREELPALRFGDFAVLESAEAFAFQRTTDRREELVVVVANASGKAVEEVLAVRDARQMGYTPLRCALSGEEVRPHSGLMYVRVPARSVRVFRATRPPEGKYTPYKRM